jgi:hypothetical protein
MAPPIPFGLPADRRSDDGATAIENMECSLKCKKTKENRTFCHS